MINVYVIDNTEQIKPALFNSTATVSLYTDELLAFNAIEQQQPAVIMLNYAMRKEESVEYIHLLLNASPKSKIVLIANELSENEIINCLIAGAIGYQEVQQLAAFADKLIHAVVAGEAWVTRHMVAKLLDSLRTTSDTSNNKKPDLKLLSL